MTNTLITIQNAASNGLIARYSASSDFWADVADVCAGLVVIAVFVEILEISPKVLRAGVELKWRCICKHKPRIDSWLAWFTKYEHRIDVWGFFFWMVIVVALAGEVLGGRIAKHFDSLIIGRLIEQSSADELKVEELRKENLELRIKFSPREISDAGMVRGIQLLKPFAGTAFKLNAPLENSEAVELMEQMESLITNSGCLLNDATEGVRSGTGPLPRGIIITGNRRTIRAASALSVALGKDSIDSSLILNPLLPDLVDVDILAKPRK